MSYTPPVRNLAARVSRWAGVPGVGEWSRIELLLDVEGAEPPHILSQIDVPQHIELLLTGVGDVKLHDIGHEAPPPADCSPAACVPNHSPNSVTIRYDRRLDLIEGRELSSCALVQRTAADALRGGTLDILQTPPSKACPIDLFVWVPHATRRQLDGESGSCGGDVGVDVGSNVLDGRGGATQRALSCRVAEPPSSPPPSPPSPPPPSPSSPPPPPPPPPLSPPLLLHLEDDGAAGSARLVIDEPRVIILASVGIAAALFCCLGLVALLRCLVARNRRKPQIDRERRVTESKLDGPMSLALALTPAVVPARSNKLPPPEYQSSMSGGPELVV